MKIKYVVDHWLLGLHAVVVLVSALCMYVVFFIKQI